jgi:hypothetical protein
MAKKSRKQQRLLSMHCQDVFSFGTDVIIDIKIQMSILGSVTGEDPYLDGDTPQ